MIVVNTEDIVIAQSTKIEIIDEQNEIGLIKVYTDLDDPYGYYYIGTPDRNQYKIYNKDVPDINKSWKYINGQFIEIKDNGNI